jgi:solute carrier family 39 (zinc transporter), member 1/2/3
MSKDEKKPCCNFTPFILMIALSVHACFEGLALGIQPDFTSALSIMLAIGIHKGAASSALGISLVKNFPDDFRLVRWLIFTFSMATPIGIAIGIAASSAGVIVDIIFSSLAAGTFVYIGCTEIIVSEFSIPGDRWLKLLVFLIGATIITCLFFIPGS